MQTESLQCICCCNEFDRGEHTPKIIPVCGHTICQACVKALSGVSKSIKCPTDRKVYQLPTDGFLPTNFSLLQILENKPKVQATNQDSKDQQAICNIHGYKLDLVCMTDEIRVCRYCIDYGSHRGHDVKWIQDVVSSGATKVEGLLRTQKKLKDSQKISQNACRNVQSRVIKLVKDSYAAARDLLEKQEADELTYINTQFNSRLQGTDKTSSDVLEKVISDKISALKGEINKAFILVLKEEDIEVDTDSEYQGLVKDLKEIYMNFEVSCKNLEKKAKELVAGVARPDITFRKYKKNEGLYKTGKASSNNDYMRRSQFFTRTSDIDAQQQNYVNGTVPRTPQSRRLTERVDSYFPNR